MGTHQELATRIPKGIREKAESLLRDALDRDGSAADAVAARLATGFVDHDWRADYVFATSDIRSFRRVAGAGDGTLLAEKLLPALEDGRASEAQLNAAWDSLEEILNVSKLHKVISFFRRRLPTPSKPPPTGFQRRTLSSVSRAARDRCGTAEACEGAGVAEASRVASLRPASAPTSSGAPGTRWAGRSASTSSPRPDRDEGYCLAGAAVDLKISEIVNEPNWLVSADSPEGIFLG